MASDYGEGIINRLHPNSPLRQEGNPARTLIMNTIGAWLDNHDVTSLYDNSFLETASGRWLDLFGKDLGVVRQLDESDTDYRTRLIYESIGDLNIDYLLNVFDLSLYSFREDFNVVDNTLVSDNCFLNTGGYIGVASEDVISLLDRKILLDGNISWVTEYGSLGYILNTQGINILSHYSEIYNLTRLYQYFGANSTIEKVKLSLPNAINCGGTFGYCQNLVDVDLQLPNVTDCEYMFSLCSHLVNIDLTLPNATKCNDMFRLCSRLVDVKLDLPKLDNYQNIFYGSSKIETININIPTSIVSGFKSYVLGLNLENLTSFKINGEEQL